MVKSPIIKSLFLIAAIGAVFLPGNVPIMDNPVYMYCVGIVISAVVFS